MEYFFGGTILFWLALAFVGPVLPMRLLSEERRSGSLEMLMTAPVTETQVVVGKYLAALAFYVVLWAADSALRGDRGELQRSWTGGRSPGLPRRARDRRPVPLDRFVRLGITRNQIVAALVGFALVFALFILGLLEFLVNDEAAASGRLPQPDPAHGGLLEGDRRHPAPGVLLEWTVFFLFLTSRALAANKWR